MSFADKIKKALTPKNTEEIKPNLFVQKRGDNYRVIKPVVWNDKVDWKVFFLGVNPLRNFIWFAIIMFLAFGFYHDTLAYKNFYQYVNSDPAAYCQNVSLLKASKIVVEVPKYNFSIDGNDITISPSNVSSNYRQA